MQKFYKVIVALCFVIVCFSTLSFAANETAFEEEIVNFEKAVISHQQIYKNSEKLGIVSFLRKNKIERFVAAVNEIKKNKISRQQIDNINKLLDQVEISLGLESMGVLLLDDLSQIETLLELFDGRKIYTKRINALRSEVKNLLSNTNDFNDIRTGLQAERYKVYSLGMEIALKCGWYPGFSSMSFGRFGWSKTEGLLCDNLVIDTVTISDELKQLGRLESGMKAGSASISQAFVETDIQVSIIPEKVSNLQVSIDSVNWISKKYSVCDPAGRLIGNIYANLQRLGLRYDYKTPTVVCTIDGASGKKSHIGYNRGGKLEWFDLCDKTIIDFRKSPMTGPAIYLSLYDNKRGERIFVVVQFQKKLARLLCDGMKLVFESQGCQIGNLWVFNSIGVGREKQRAHEMAKSPEQALRANALCGINLSWPSSCNEYFRVNATAGKIQIRNEVKFEQLKDDWSTVPLVVSAISPVMMLAKSLGVNVVLPENYHDWNIPTKYGNYCTVPTGSFEYSIPFPATDRGRIFADASQKQWSENISEQLFYKNSADVCSVDWAYKGITSALKAVDYIGQQEIYAQADKIIPEILLDKDKFWKAYTWRFEPLSEKRFCYDYPRRRYADGGTLVDINWGNALCFYGLDTWAAYRNKWQVLDKSWDMIWSGFAYFQRTHDWAWGTDSISENGEGAAIDCLTACYSGLVGLSRMSYTLDRKWEYNQAIYATAKAAITHSARFGFLEYVQKNDMWHDDSPHTGTVNGFHENGSWIHPTTVGPWWGVCSLSGFGMQNEAFETAFAYMGKQRMENWWKKVKSIYPYMYDPNKAYPGVRLVYGGNSQYITLPALYMDFWLGVKSETLMKHYKGSLANKMGYEFGANVLADIASRNCPVKISDWGKCNIVTAVYDPKSNQAEMTIINPAREQKEIILISCQKMQIRLNGKLAKQANPDGNQTQRRTVVNVNPGTTKIIISFIATVAS